MDALIDRADRAWRAYNKACITNAQTLTDESEAHYIASRAAWRAAEKVLKEAQDAQARARLTF